MYVCISENKNTKLKTRNTTNLSLKWCDKHGNKDDRNNMSQSIIIKMTDLSGEISCYSSLVRVRGNVPEARAK